jgi:hypothetical protein
MVSKHHKQSFLKLCAQTARIATIVYCYEELKISQYENLFIHYKQRPGRHLQVIVRIFECKFSNHVRTYFMLG